jgi:hypothetical protein
VIRALNTANLLIETEGDKYGSADMKRSVSSTVPRLTNIDKGDRDLPLRLEAVHDQLLYGVHDAHELYNGT